MEEKERTKGSGRVEYAVGKAVPDPWIGSFTSIDIVLELTVVAILAGEVARGGYSSLRRAKIASIRAKAMEILGMTEHS